MNYSARGREISMKTLTRSGWTRLIVDAVIVGFVALCAAYFLVPDAAAAENVETLTITIQFLP